MPFDDAASSWQCGVNMMTIYGENLAGAGYALKQRKIKWEDLR